MPDPDKTTKLPCGMCEGTGKLTRLRGTTTLVGDCPACWQDPGWQTPLPPAQRARIEALIKERGMKSL